MKKRAVAKKKQISGMNIIRYTWRVISVGISILMFIIFAMIFVSILGAFLPAEGIGKGNVAVIPIEGIITTDGSTGFTPGAKSQSIVKLIEKADDNDDIEAIILEINSPGGTPVATDEIAQAISQTNKTTIAVIRESGASGAYWIATAADKIYANRMSVTGSIGVQASKLQFAGLIADYNITYQRLVAGKYKDAGSRFKILSDEEKQLFQQVVDTLHTEFIRTVAENRNLDEDYVRGLATGFIYLGIEAKELGLVDELGGKKEALEYLEETLDIEAEPVTYKQRKGLFDSLTEMTAQGFHQMGQGIGSAFTTETQVSFT